MRKLTCSRWQEVKWRIIAIVALILLLGAACAAQVGEVINLGARRELFVDNYLIDTSTGVELRLHHPVLQEVVMRYDCSWEGNACGYQTVFRDGPIYRMYYNASMYGMTKHRLHDIFIAYAESKDGKHWVRPELGLVEVNGSKKNNIIWT